MGRLVNRVRSKAYLASVRGKPCLVCGSPGEAHHLQFAQPRAMSRKTGDQWVVPLCHPCHMKLHEAPMREVVWWATKGILPMVWAENNYSKWEKENGNKDD